MLLTVAWGGSLFLGRCDLDDNGEAIDETGEGINCRKQVEFYCSMLSVVLSRSGHSLLWFSLLVAQVKISNLFDNASFVLNAVTFMTFANSNLVTYVSLTSICKPIFFKIPGVH